MPQFELKRLADRSNENILAEIRRVAKLVPSKKLSRAIFNKHAKISSSGVEKRFGSWTKALEAAGLSEQIDLSNKKVSKEAVIAELQRVAKLVGAKSYDHLQFNAYARFKYGVVKSRFKTWHKAMQAAGLKTNTRGRRYTDEECFENLFTVWSHYGRPPKYQEMNLSPSIVGAKAYVVRWKTWNRALQNFVNRVDTKPESLSNVTIPQQSDSKVPVSAQPELKENKRSVPLSLRWKVLQRDHFRCIRCGYSPATNFDGRTLEADHKIPYSKGGKTIESNLETLCNKCNNGKSNSTVS